MDITKLKNKMLKGFNRDYEENYLDFDSAVKEGNINELFEYSGIKTEIDWRKKLEKYYKVKIDSYEDIAILSDENADINILKDTDDQLIFELNNVSGDWQLPITYKVIISSKGRKKIDLGAFENDFREYTNYISEIELIAKYLNYDVENLSGEELVIILNEYIDPVLINISNAAKNKKLITDYDSFVKPHEADFIENIYNLKSFYQLPEEISEKLFNHIIKKLQEYPFN